MSLDLSFIGQSQAASANKTNATRLNRLNRRMFEESRGSKGSAVLPTYLKDASGNPWESAVLGRDLMDIYDVTNELSPADEMAKYGTVVDRFAPAQTSADAFSSKIFNGGITDEMLENAKPVGQARLDIAPMKKQAAIEALHTTLSEISAAQASKGFAGSDGLARRRLEFGARKGANTVAADELSQARLANALEEQSIRNFGNITLPGQNLDLPYNQTRRAMDVLRLPEDAYLDAYARRLQPFNFTKIGGGQPFQYQPMPAVQAGTGAGWGAIAGVAGTALNAYLKNREYQRLQNLPNRMATTEAYNYGSASPGMAGWNTYGGGGTMANGGYIGDVNVGGGGFDAGAGVGGGFDAGAVDYSGFA